MKALILKITVLICYIQTHQANNSMSSLEYDTLLKVKQLLSNKSVTYYIAGGTRDLEVLQYSKYMVSIRTRNPLRYFGDNHFCSGIVISKAAVLTSGHCVMDKTRVLTRARRVLLVGGTPNRLEPSETTVQFPVKNIVAHTNFVRRNKNDIAVIHLKQQIPENNEGVKIIKMPSGPPNRTASCTVLGWGRMLMKGPLPALPFHVNVTIQEAEVCKSFLKEYYYDGILCAVGRTSDDGPCLGDTGSPLICNNELTGIVSFVTGCIWKNSPSLFTDVWHHRKWIKKHLNSASLSHKNHKIHVIFIALGILTQVYLLNSQ